MGRRPRSVRRPVGETDRRYRVVATPVDDVLLIAEQGEVTRALFANHQLDRWEWGVPADPDDAILGPAGAQLEEYFAGAREYFDIPLGTDGGPFNDSVWKLLCDIPYGTTVTYGSIAKQLGDRALSQRVGQAVGSNPIAIIIPCHRVIGADGSLTGFGGGLDRKRMLLRLEEPSAESAGRLF